MEPFSMEPFDADDKFCLVFRKVVENYIKNLPDGLPENSAKLEGKLMARLSDSFLGNTLDNPIFDRVYDALEQVFRHDAAELDLHMGAVSRALPEWKTTFKNTLNAEFRQGVIGPNAPHAPEFNIMGFMGPTTTTTMFIDALKVHIQAFAHLHETENVVLDPPQNRIVFKPNGQPGSVPTGAKSNAVDPNFYHRCAWCTDKDHCSRDDDAFDHMHKKHNYYSDINDLYARAHRRKHLIRKQEDVLQALIKKERVVYNSLLYRYREAAKECDSQADCQVANGLNDRDANEVLLAGKGNKLVSILLRERRANFGITWEMDKKIKAIYKAAWQAWVASHPQAFHW